MFSTVTDEVTDYYQNYLDQLGERENTINYQGY